MRASVLAEAKHEQYELTLDAIEFLAGRRKLVPIGRYESPHYHDDPRETKRRNVRV